MVTVSAAAAAAAVSESHCAFTRGRTERGARIDGGERVREKKKKGGAARRRDASSRGVCVGACRGARRV
ncbi:Protein of unknown function [Gryllus bimaculatus]|nr:Protein of unknown function [Gryllus bimaculatus]